MQQYQLAEIRFIVFGPELELFEVGVQPNGNVVVRHVTDNRMVAFDIGFQAEGAGPIPPFVHNACTLLPPSIHQLADPRGDICLYHFTKMDSAKAILRSGIFRLSSFSRMNDPRESRDWHFDVYCDELHEDPRLAINISGELSRLLKGRGYLGCFATDNLPWTDAGLSEIGQSPALLHPSMWSAYAENHKGVVLAFRRNNFVRSLITAHPKAPKMYGAVRYVPADLHEGEPFRVDLPAWRELGAAGYATAHFNTHWRQLLFSKFDGWKHEQEHRFVVFWNEAASAPEIPISPALVDVCIGELANEADGIELKQLADAIGVNVSRMRWKNGKPMRVGFVSGPVSAA